MAGDKYVGLYQVSFKLINALQFLPLAFVASLYPAFSTYWGNNRDQLVVTFERSINYLTIVSLPITVGIIMLSQQILELLKPEYMEGKTALQISMIALIFIFISYPVGSLLNACDRQKINTFNMGIVLVVSVILNFILIPKFQASGAAVTVVITSLLMFILGMLVVPKIIKYRPRKIIIPALKAILSAFLMSVFILLTRNHLNMFIIIPISGLIYFGALLATGAFKKEDLLSILSSFKRKKISA
jgi:O-antigen/teichoic acid export membrane protein